VRLLITRPKEDAGPLALRLAEHGIASEIAPMLTIRQRSAAAPDLTGAQALLFTSANGVRAFVAASPARELAVFAVGAATAAAAQEAGFESVVVAGGDVSTLAALVRNRLDPAGGRLIHVAGSAVAGDLAGTLGAAGFEITRAVLYEAVPATALSTDLRGALAEGRLDGVLFLSPRTAKTFVTLVDKGGLEAAYRTLHAYCLSAAVADAVRERPWGALSIAAQPTQDALLAIVTKADGV